jgi:hypothetical protein
MKDLFDPANHPLPDTDGCDGCGSKGGGTFGMRRKFASMTGLEWGARNLATLPLGKDCDTLGIEGDDIPDGVSLCVSCAVKYMTQFNERLASLKSKAALPGSSRR